MDTAKSLSGVHGVASTSTSSTKPVVLPSNYTATTPSESFPDPSHGILTWHTLFSSPSTPTDSLSAGIAVCPPRGGHLCKHRHTQAEIYYILAGKGVMTIEGVRYAVESGSSVFIPGDAEHGVENTGEDELKWLYVFPGGAFGDVVYRFSGQEEKEEGGRG